MFRISIFYKDNAIVDDIIRILIKFKAFHVLITSHVSVYV